MSNLNELSSSVQHLAKAYRSVIALGEHLSGVAAIDNLADEARARTVAAEEAEAKATAALAAAESEYRERVRVQEQALEDGQRQFDTLKREAEDRAARIIADAERAASEVAFNAQREANRLAVQASEALATIENAERIVAELTAEKEQLTNSIAELKARFA